MAKHISNTFRSSFFANKYSNVRKICCKRIPETPGSTKNELDKMAIMLNYMKLDPGVIMKKYSKELLISGFSFSTESGRILEEGLIKEGGLLKNSPSKGGA